MNWRRLFGFDRAPADGLGNELRAALATIVKRAMEDGDLSWSVNLYGCSIRGIRVGDWQITAQKIERDNRSDEQEG